MDRRLFLRGLVSAPFAVAAFARACDGALAAPPAIPKAVLADPGDKGAVAPDGTPIELARSRRRYRKVCRTYRDRWGRRFRRCHWRRIR